MIPLPRSSDETTRVPSVWGLGRGGGDELAPSHDPTRGQRSCCYRRLRYAGSDRMRRPCSCQTILVTPRYVMTSSVLSVELVSVAYDRMKD